ncbi:MAG: hypothetical protein HND27_05365 [Bacteroidetes bacterium]|nr:hypothetical protein [Bacteroidota bacterium]MBV6462225.1 hypothetical protein [Flavobacteriales bacterium]WKZ74811.1 MAG: hypothetical protein QY303_11750 [Vicingaceae bacterium]MCL4816031.1 hypothetical protein [Flavobacteriales bacterium]NOG95190.1 hypothetical protein [Bacteroidota bacterium]
MKFVSIILKSLLGIFFIFSGWLKLAPIEPFEFIFVDLGFANWTFAPILSRLVIGIEFLLGLLLISQLFHKKTLIASFGLILFFSVFLLFLLFSKGNDTDCGCMGIHYSMSPIESLLKNAVILLLLAFVYYKGIEVRWGFQKYALVLFIITSLCMPYILEVPDYNVPNPYRDETGYKMKIELLDTEWKNYSKELGGGKKIICFFSTGCRFCRLAGYKLSIIQKNYGKPIPAHFVFWSEGANVEEYWHASKSFKFPNHTLPTEKFFQLSGSELPAVFLVNNGVVVKKLPFRNLEEKEITDFLNH